MKDMDKQFDQSLIEELREIIPLEGEIQEINPWSRPLGLIIWGLILTSIKLNFLFLHYILPTLGSAQIYLGFRSLRRENKYFKTLWLMSMVRLALHLYDMVAISTPLGSFGNELSPLTITLVIFHISMFPIFHIALKNVYEKSGKIMEESPLLWATLWSFLSTIIAISPISSSWLIFIPMMIFYILIIRSLISISDQLGEVGYSLKNSPVKINDQTLGWTYFLLVFVISLGLNIFFNHLRLEAHEFSKPETSILREDLLSMGYPKEALQYLSDVDVEKLKGAINVEVVNDLLMFDAKESEHIEDYGYSKQVSYTYEAGKKNIESSTIYIEMPENTLYVMQYFKWTGGRPLWQDGLMISGNDEVEKKELISSGLFYKKKDKDYVGDFPRISLEEVEVNSMFGVYEAKVIKASLSFPAGSREQGGYIFYRYGTMLLDMYFMPHSFNYLHQAFPIRIPYKRAEELMGVGGFNFSNNYKNHYTTYESLGRKEIDKDIKYEIID